MNQQIASREAEIERLKHLIRRDGSNDLSGGSMLSDPGEMNRARRVEELFQKLGSPSPNPHQGGFAGSSSQLKKGCGSKSVNFQRKVSIQKVYRFVSAPFNTRRSEGDEAFLEMWASSQR